MFKKLLLVVAAGGLLAACESTSSLPYQVSTQNVIAAQRVLTDDGNNVSVGAFTASEEVEKPICRLAGQLDIAPGQEIETFIRDAFESELFMTGAYDPNGTAITANIDTLAVNTFGTGSWEIAMTVQSEADPVGYQVTSTHTFASSFSAVAACQNAATSFNPAVQNLLSDVVNHPGFAALTGN